MKIFSHYLQRQIKALKDASLLSNSYFSEKISWYFQLILTRY